MRKASDLVGKTFGQLTVSGRTGSNDRGDALWQCTCTCGGGARVKTGNLVAGITKSCGCMSTGPKAESIAGQRFGRLTALSMRGKDKSRGSLWLCACDCGNTTVARISGLRCEQVQSCGCIHAERVLTFNGTGNPNYDPDITDDERVRARNFEEYRSWASEVKRRDEYKCQVCFSSPSGELVSHHLYSFKDFPDLNANVDNGVCLCVDHHLEFHKIFGFRRNTLLQFLQFKEMNDGKF